MEINREYESSNKDANECFSYMCGYVISRSVWLNRGEIIKSLRVQEAASAATNLNTKTYVRVQELHERIRVEQGLGLLE